MERSLSHPSASQSDQPSAIGIGDVIHGKYRVERVIGEGGMGVVVAAQHLTLDKPVAIKLLSQKSRESPEALERFTREAKAAARIQSEHVGKVLDVDSLPGGAPFIVMEYLDGRDLAAELRDQGALPLDRALVIVLEACEAVAEAHAAGIVHRDLKPANLFLSRTSDGREVVKVLDFGISKFTSQEPSKAISAEKALTSANAMLGSPLYMSPEQMQASGDVDLRTDIWSIGVMLYEMLTARAPFDAATIPMICANVLSLPPPPLGLAGAPDGLERILLRCLEKEPDRRYRDVAHLVRSLLPFAPAKARVSLDRILKLKGLDGSLAATPASLAPPPMREGGATITSWDEHTVAKPPRKWLPLAIGGGVVALLAAVGLVVGLSGEPPAQVPAATPQKPTSLPAQTTPVDAPAVTAAPTADPTPEVAASPSATAVASSATSAVAPVPNAPWRPKPTGTSRTSGFGGRE